jgi:hypothetical protein
MAEPRPLERLTASDLFSQAPQSGIRRREPERFSDLAHASVLHMGRVLHAMAEAMVEILQFAGFQARVSNDDLAPATVEVLGSGRPPGPVGADAHRPIDR